MLREKKRALSNFDCMMSDEVGVYGSPGSIRLVCTRPEHRAALVTLADDGLQSKAPGITMVSTVGIAPRAVAGPAWHHDVPWPRTTTPLIPPHAPRRA